jgi:hypothetical protein
VHRPTIGKVPKVDLFSWLRREDVRRRPPDPPGNLPGNPAPGDPAVPTPVTVDRVKAWCRRRGYTYFVDSEGDLGGLWRGRLFYFFLLGPSSDLIQVRGHWNREFAIERLPEVLELCNTWHVERIWPTCYARVRDNGMVTVTAEVTADVGPGATDDQLDLLLQCGIGTSTVFFDELDRTYRDPAGAAP